MNVLFNLKTISFIICTLLLPVISAEAGQYLNSAHGNASTGVNRSSIDPVYSQYATGNCNHCHEHHASINGSEADPVDGNADDYLLFTR